MKLSVPCPRCGAEVGMYRNPLPTADIIIRVNHGIVLIKRKNPPHGWAIPGGFIDYGESAEQAAVREARRHLAQRRGVDRCGTAVDDPGDSAHGAVQPRGAGVPGEVSVASGAGV